MASKRKLCHLVYIPYKENANLTNTNRLKINISYYVAISTKVAVKRDLKINFAKAALLNHKNVQNC
jgi:hypothetical protein